MYKKYFNITLLLYLVVFTSTVDAQSKRKFKVHTIGFYNVENLFDTINNPNKYDEASPMMELKTGRSEVYKKKVQNIY